MCYYKKLWVLSWVGFFQSQNESTEEKISVNELEEPSNILSAGRSDNNNISYSEKSAKIWKNSNSDSNSSSGFLDEGKKESVQP